MAAFVFKRTSFGATPNRGRKATMNDASMVKIFEAYRKSYGAGLTDDQITDAIFDGLLTGLVQSGDKDAKLSAATTAAESVPPISSVIAPDNT